MSATTVVWLVVHENATLADVLLSPGYFNNMLAYLPTFAGHYCISYPWRMAG